MHKVILFRGGMCGDVLLSMLNKRYVENYNPLKQKKKFVWMKKFYKYSLKEKDKYFKQFDNDYTLSHDTDYCYKIKNNVIQLFCSDISMLAKFSERFWTKNDRPSIEHVIKDLNSTDNDKLKDYENDLLSWQTAHKFPKRFDIKDIFTNKFVEQVNNFFAVDNIEHANLIHTKWLKSQIR